MNRRLRIRCPLDLAREPTKLLPSLASEAQVDGLYDDPDDMTPVGWQLMLPDARRTRTATLRVEVTSQEFDLTLLADSPWADKLWPLAFIVSAVPAFAVSLALAAYVEPRLPPAVAYIVDLLVFLLLFGALGTTLWIYVSGPAFDRALDSVHRRADAAFAARVLAELRTNTEVAVLSGG